MTPLHATAAALAAGALPRRSAEEVCLHFNGPGASGFGVKKALLMLPESAMLLISPACCGRHATLTGARDGFSARMCYLRPNESALAVGSYLRQISEAAARTVAVCHPRALILCMTCVDAMLGTDLARIAARVSQELSLPVTYDFMDPICREGKTTPIAEAICASMQLIPPFSEKREEKAILLGEFTTLDRESELFSILHAAGIADTAQLAEMDSFAHYEAMGDAAHVIVLSPRGGAAADWLCRQRGMRKQLLGYCYGPGRIEAAYRSLFTDRPVPQALSQQAQAARDALRALAQRRPHLRVGVGEAIAGNPLELALTLVEAGIDVRFVFRAIVREADRPLLRALPAALPVFSGVHPSMPGGVLPEVDAIIGADAGFFAPGVPVVALRNDLSPMPYGFSALMHLIRKLDDALDGRGEGTAMRGSYLVV